MLASGPCGAESPLVAIISEGIKSPPGAPPDQFRHPLGLSPGQRAAARGYLQLTLGQICTVLFLFRAVIVAREGQAQSGFS